MDSTTINVIGILASIILITFIYRFINNSTQSGKPSIKEISQFMNDNKNLPTKKIVEMVQEKYNLNLENTFVEKLLDEEKRKKGEIS